MNKEEEVYDFGLRLKEFREQLHLSQQEVADRIDVSVSSIKRYEANTQLPPVDKLEKMAILYNTSLDYLRNLTSRKAFYLDGLTPSQQELIIEFVDKLKREFHKL